MNVLLVTGSLVGLRPIESGQVWTYSFWLIDIDKRYRLVSDGFELTMFFVICSINYKIGH